MLCNDLWIITCLVGLLDSDGTNDGTKRYKSRKAGGVRRVVAMVGAVGDVVVNIGGNPDTGAKWI